MCPAFSALMTIGLNNEGSSPSAFHYTLARISSDPCSGPAINTLMGAQVKNQNTSEIRSANVSSLSKEKKKHIYQ